MEGEVHLETPPPCASESREGMELARRAATHVDELAWERNADGWISPLEWPFVIATHVLQERCLPTVLAIP